MNLASLPKLGLDWVGLVEVLFNLPIIHHRFRNLSQSRARDDCWSINQKIINANDRHLKRACQKCFI